MVQPNPDKSAWWLKDSYSPEEIEQLVRWWKEHFWLQNHQTADLSTPGGPQIMTKGEGCYIYDIDGNKYIDGMAGLFLKNIGHEIRSIGESSNDILNLSNRKNVIMVSGVGQ